MSTLEDSLEEFDLRYIESCNQVINATTSPLLTQRANSVASETNQRLKLSSPLSNHQELYFTTSSSTTSTLNSPRNSVQFDIYNEQISPNTRQSPYDSFPIKPSVTIASVDTYSKFQRSFSVPTASKAGLAKSIRKKSNDGSVSKPRPLRRTSSTSNSTGPQWSKFSMSKSVPPSGRSSSLTSPSAALSLDVIAARHVDRISDDGSIDGDETAIMDSDDIEGPDFLNELVTKCTYGLDHSTNDVEAGNAAFTFSNLPNESSTHNDLRDQRVYDANIRDHKSNYESNFIDASLSDSLLALDHSNVYDKVDTHFPFLAGGEDILSYDCKDVFFSND